MRRNDATSALGRRPSGEFRLNPLEWQHGPPRRHHQSRQRFARRVLIEGAWTYRMQARVSRKLHDRIEQLPSTIRDIAWKAQLRSAGVTDI